MAGTHEENANNVEWLKEQGDRLRAEADTVNRENAAVKAECQALRVQLQNSETARDAAQQAAKIAAERLDKLKGDHEQNAASLRDVNAERGKIAAELKQARRLAKDRRVALYDMAQELAKLQRRLADLLTDEAADPE